MKDRTIIIVGGGLLQVPVVQIAKDMGLLTVVTDRDPGCACSDLADAIVELDIYDIPGHIRLAQVFKTAGSLSAVFTAGADVAVTVAHAAAAVGLPTVDPRAAHICKNKARTREAFDKAGLLNPGWAEVETEPQVKAAIQEIGYPFIIKNVDNCASRGTTIFLEKSDDAEIFKAVERAKVASTTRTALIEQFIEGEEQTVETLIWAGNFYPCFITDRLFQPLDKYAVEYALRSPTKLSEHIQDRLYYLAWRAANALGIDFGACKLDTLVTRDGDIYILEVAARLSGGFDCQYLVPTASGKEVIKAAMLLALGESMDRKLLESRWDKCAVSYNPLPTPGRITAINGLEKAKVSDGVEHIFMRMGVGDIIPEYKDCAARPCWIITAGNNHLQAWESALRAADGLTIETDAI